MKSNMIGFEPKIKLNLLIDKSEIFHNTVEFNNTSSGYYCLKETMVPIKECNVNFEKGDNETNKCRILPKLHSRFANLIKNKSKKLMTNAGIWDDLYDNLACKLLSLFEIC